LLRICYVKQEDVKHKLQVLCGDKHIEYNLKADGSIEDFSLQFGSGDYTARILQNKSGSDYIEIESKSFSVSLSNESIVYLNAIQNVRWDYEMQPIQDVRKIIAPALEQASDDKLLFECVSALYNFVCIQIDYDNDKTGDLGYDYLPDIEQTYAVGKGICYDYASLLAAMLRSIGIPAKLVKGYANYNPGVYHAWNEVYLDGEWHVIDTTLDAAAGVYEPMFKNAADYTKVSEY
jgi:transglutaminase/protease-like cytokinesis protein 3